MPENRYCEICEDIDGYWLYVCYVCEEIWCGDDPLLKEGSQECSCGEIVESGWVECCTCNKK